MSERHHRAILAVDPGSTGCIVAASLETDRARLLPLRFKKADHGFLVEKRSLSRAFDIFRDGVDPLVVVEDVTGRGGWGAQANFSFGAVVGAITAIAHDRGLRITSVVPRAWQAIVHDPDVEGDAKMRSLEAYCRLFPHDPLPRNKAGKVDHNAVDALLIAWWGARTLGAPTRAWRFS